MTPFKKIPDRHTYNIQQSGKMWKKTRKEAKKEGADKVDAIGAMKMVENKKKTECEKSAAEKKKADCQKEKPSRRKI
ncbi:hypothetical protein JTB14_004797 [Gonioctena quinquepunctata]|nr:hypothetical protein JTB14_004797 [Gonioctena quinquepunctata]